LLLQTLGIDPTKEGEVYHNARISLGPITTADGFISWAPWKSLETFHPCDSVRISQ
jgi:hypothetical protein